jgi:hypothetical protein
MFAPQSRLTFALLTCLLHRNYYGHYHINYYDICTENYYVFAAYFYEFATIEIAFCVSVIMAFTPKLLLHSSVINYAFAQ